MIKSALEEASQFAADIQEKAEKLRETLLAERKIYEDKCAEIDAALAKLPGGNKKPTKNRGGKALSFLAQEVLTHIHIMATEKADPPTREQIIQSANPRANNKDKGKIWLAIRELEDTGKIQENESKKFLIVDP
jgi:hypothetical protein